MAKTRAGKLKTRRGTVYTRILAWEAASWLRARFPENFQGIFVQEPAGQKKQGHQGPQGQQILDHRPANPRQPPLQVLPLRMGDGDRVVGRGGERLEEIDAHPGLYGGGELTGFEPRSIGADADISREPRARAPARTFSSRSPPLRQDAGVPGSAAPPQLLTTTRSLSGTPPVSVGMS